jgi:NTE family protein
VERGRARAHSNRDGVDPDDFDFDRSGYRARLILDQLDNPNFPGNGWIADAQLFAARESLGSDAEYDRLHLGLLGAVSFGRHTLVGSLEHDSALGTDLPIYEEFTLGGLFRLSGYPLASLSGRYLDLGLASYYYRIGDFGTRFLRRLYGGCSVEAGNVWRQRDQAGLDDLLWSGSVYVAVDTYLGPAYLAYGRAQGGRDTWYLFVGRSF